MKITSDHIKQEIYIALSYRDIAAGISRRNKDDRLDCRYIRCEVTSDIDADVSKFKVMFNYEYIRSGDKRGEDVIEDVIYDEQWQAINWQAI